MKIAVVGLGYVGLSVSILLSQKHVVIGVDTSEDKINLINARVSPLEDYEIKDFLENKSLNLTATLNLHAAVENADYVIIATPTNFDPNTNTFDTSSIDSVIEQTVQANSNANIVIKSTLPIGYVKSARERFSTVKIMFSPEFLREGRALSDNLHPTRIVVGDNSKAAKKFAAILQDCAFKTDIPVLFVGPDEAEATKLFSNTYLAMRVAYFNELDNYCVANELNMEQIIDGMSLDTRIGRHYNNPSFGYGGYCLPKDTKQVEAAFANTPQALISAIVDSNMKRKHFISTTIAKMSPKVIGVYRLIMKAGSDNFRESASLDVANLLAEQGFCVIVYEPNCSGSMVPGIQLVNDLEKFKKISSVILANRIDGMLDDVREKIFSRDLFGAN